MKGLFIPEITAEMFRNGCLESIETLMAEGEIYDIEYSEWIPIKTKPLTEKEKEEMGTESDYMYDCPLPDDGEEVEITTHLGDVTMDIFCRESGGCYFENYCDDGEVLAWRHKPEPYKAESEE